MKRLVPAVVAAILILSSFAHANDVVKVAETTGVGLRILPILIARDEGFFNQEGLELRFSIVDAGPNVIAAGFVSGDIDFVLDNGGLLAALGRGVPIVYRQPVFAVPARLIARPGVKLEEIKGRTVLTQYALGHGMNQVLQGILGRRGLAPIQLQRVSDPMLIIDMLGQPGNKGKYDFALLAFRILDAEEAGLTTLLNYPNLPEVKIYAYWVQRQGISSDVVKRFWRVLDKSLRFMLDPANKSKVVGYFAKYVEKDQKQAEKVYDKLLLESLSLNFIVNDDEFIEYAKFFQVDLPKSRIREFYNPQVQR